MKKKEFGTEKSTKPLSVLHDHVSVSKLTLNRLYIVTSIGFWVLYVSSTIFKQFTNTTHEFQTVVEAALYILIVTLLNFSALIYLFSREGAFKRFNQHTRVPREKIDQFFTQKQPTITVLVPSYDEEVAVIRKTLLSAALQEYPQMRVVLLIDDNPVPNNPQAFEKLEATKRLIHEITTLLQEPRDHFEQVLKVFERGQVTKKITGDRLRAIAREYTRAGDWLSKMAQQEINEDHVDQFFIEQVLHDLANELYLVAKALLTAANQQSAIDYARAHQLYCRLVWLFKVELDYFQRKKYSSLSHEANKAMNLNAYVDLMGGSYQIERTPAGDILTRTEETPDVVIPDSEFLLTLDADSILLREYCLHLVYLLNQAENKKVAVTQTPYSSFRGTPTRIERIAGATTDLQHILHQGTTYYGATFWVGANAVIRKKALEDIAEISYVNGFKIRRFIQDRTVNEDTESSVDLEKHGWQLVNYPERLSYSATPPDFGSLIIQRRRWANGGLLILPKLFGTMKQRKKAGHPIKWMEFCMRLNYMASISWASFSLIFLLAYPFAENLLSVYILCSALPYFMAMAGDLNYSRYKRTDIFRIYGFNLILLAVNLAGVLKSIQQALTGEKIPFARTPKVNNRTASPTIYLLMPVAIILFSSFMCYRSLLVGNWGNALFAGFNAITATWAFVSYIGIWNMCVDIFHNFIDWFFVEVKPKHTTLQNPVNDLNWQAVLYYGDDKNKVPLNVELQYSKLLAKKREE
jgi:cellulose synthase/poly-beta-1,6-N-acetylglucosamine synthase-like glycosyltransferase